MPLLGCAQVREAGPGQRGSRLVLLYRMTEGVCPRSYGYEVASLAGIAGSVVERAREVGPSIGAMGEALLGRKRKRTSVGVVGDEEAAAREGRARGAAPGWEGTSVLESTVCEAIAAIMSGGDAAMRARDMCLERLTAGIAG